MDKKKLILIALALVVAVGAAIGVNTMMRGSATPQVQAAAAPKVDGPMVLVATKSLPVGTIIEADAFRYQPWPSELMEQHYFVKAKTDISKLVGAVVRNPITAGEPVTNGSLVMPGDRGFLAAALGPGMRAVTIAVSAESGVAGFVFPGDRVDIVLTQTVDPTDDGPSLKAAETIVRNVRVLATDQRTQSVDDKGKPEVKVVSNVTLEATPRIAEKIEVAKAIGKLSLSLRSLADNNAELERAIASGEVSVPNDKKGEAAALVQVASRPVDVGTTAVAGGDVSRFQRRSMPPRKNKAAEAERLIDKVGSIVDKAAPVAPPVPAGPTANAAPAAPAGPMVRVIRGDQVTIVPVGGN